MINERRTNPIVARKLAQLISSRQREEIETYLLSLSNADFRSVGHILADDLLLQYGGEDFWEIFSHLSLFRPKAFLGTCLKAAVVQYRAGKIVLSGDALVGYAAAVVSNEMSIDRDKFLASMLEVAQKYDEIDALFDMFNLPQGRERVRFLLRCTTPPAYYALFCSLKHVHDDQEFIRKCCYALIKKGDNLSYNLASILFKYFDIPNVKDVFALRIEAYQLSYLDASQESFTKVLTNI